MINLQQLTEVFKPIYGYEGFYEVSNFGRVKSLLRTIHTINSDRVIKERMLSPKTDRDGYKEVLLWKNNTRKHLRVHRLVLLSFFGHPENVTDLTMHLDDNPANNNLSNLKWGTPFENTMQAIERQRRISKKGIENVRSKKILQLDLSGNKINEFYGTREASRKTKINRSCILSCCVGRQITAGSYKWQYWPSALD